MQRLKIRLTPQISISKDSILNYLQMAHLGIKGFVLDKKTREPIPGWFVFAASKKGFLEFSAIPFSFFQEQL